MKKEDIEKAAVDSCVIENSIFNPELTPYYEQGFKDGAEWRINRVWHDSTEKPIPGKLLLVKTLYGDYDLCYYGGYVWNTVITWAYVKDLIADKEE